MVIDGFELWFDASVLEFFDGGNVMMWLDQLGNARYVQKSVVVLIFLFEGWLGKLGVVFDKFELLDFLIFSVSGTIVL